MLFIKVTKIKKKKDYITFSESINIQFTSSTVSCDENLKKKKVQNLVHCGVESQSLHLNKF